MSKLGDTKTLLNFKSAEILWKLNYLNYLTVFRKLMCGFYPICGQKLLDILKVSKFNMLEK